MPPDSAAPSPERGPSRGSRGRPQRYRRHPKPPYSYLALIALVICAAPGRRLKLAQIIQQLRSLFPFFGGGYQGWKDSVRHNLSSNPCFAKVLKDPSKPQAKGNYWTVDVSRIPRAALKLQNTAVARGGGATTFAPDLAPFVLLGCPFPAAPRPPPSPPAPPPLGPCSFSIAALLRDPKGGDPKGGPGPGPGTPTESPPAEPPPAALWGSLLPLPPAPPPWVPPALGGERPGGSGCAPEGGPRASPPGWGQLPTSYSTTVAPNAVARPSGPPLVALPWGVLRPAPPPAPPLEPEGGGQAGPPPNKSIFDVWLSHPGDVVPPPGLQG